MFFKQKCSQNWGELKCWNFLLQLIAKKLLHSSNFVSARIASHPMKVVGKFLFQTWWQCEVNSILQEPGRLSRGSPQCQFLYKISPAMMEPAPAHLKAFDTCKDPAHPLDDKEADKLNAVWLRPWSGKIKFCLQLLQRLMAAAPSSCHAQSPGRAQGTLPKVSLCSWDNLGLPKTPLALLPPLSNK